jgi:GTPase
MTRHARDPAPGAAPERAYLVAVLPQRASAEEELDELRELLRTAGVEAAGELVQRRAAPDTRTYIGKGKLRELKEAIAEAKPDFVAVDDDLDPSQQRRLEDALEIGVVDRTQLILDIFAQHAVTAEGKLQVELAQLEYNLPRMRGLWLHLERTGGGTGAGRRGPGETQLETDRRLARRRITLLKGKLEELGRRRETQRKSRRAAATPVVALAGYTNAGKSTLLNALTNANVSVNDRLFETLDPTTRAFEQDGRRYLVTDTVGFIRRLPHQLVQGFAATLEETLLADLVLHVADASQPEERLGETVRAVESVLAGIGATELPIELVLNKIDSVDPLHRRRLANRFPEALQISAHTGEGLDELRARVAERFASRFQPVRLLVPYGDGKALADLYALGAPIDGREDGADGVLVVARLPQTEIARFAPYLVAEPATVTAERA